MITYKVEFVSDGSRTTAYTEAKNIEDAAKNINKRFGEVSIASVVKAKTVFVTRKTK